MLPASPSSPDPKGLPEYLVTGRFLSSDREFTPFLVSGDNWATAVHKARQPGIVVDRIEPYIWNGSGPKPPAEPPSESEIAAEAALTITRGQADALIREARGIKQVGQGILMLAFAILLLLMAQCMGCTVRLKV